MYYRSLEFPPIPEPVKGLKCNPMDLYPLDEPHELERLALFGMFVAGKGAASTWPKTELMFSGPESPFERVRKWVKDGTHEDKLKEYKIGNYSRLKWGLRDIAALPLKWRWPHLLNVSGISFKSAKLVQVYTWPGTERGACIDRHVLRFLKGPMILPKDLRKIVPDDSPQNGQLYAMLEGFLCRYADHLNLADWELDRLLWQAGQKKIPPHEFMREHTKTRVSCNRRGFDSYDDKSMKLIGEEPDSESRILRKRSNP